MQNDLHYAAGRKVIEAKLKAWIEEEMESEEVPTDYFIGALTDNHDAIDLWNEFAVWHCEDLRELVREQIKAVLRNRDERKNKKVS